MWSLLLLRTEDGQSGGHEPPTFESAIREVGEVVFSVPALSLETARAALTPAMHQCCSAADAMNHTRTQGSDSGIRIPIGLAHEFDLLRHSGTALLTG